MLDVLTGLFWVALGGAIGGPARFFVSGLVGRNFGETFPWGTLAVNVVGSFLIGAGAALGPPSTVWLFAASGVLGAFTTVSSFSLQTLALVRNGEPGQASLNTALSLAFCFGACAFGFGLAQVFAK